MRADLNRQVAELRDLVLKLQTRIDDLEKKSHPVVEVKEPVVAAIAPAPTTPSLLENTTINVAFDGYYGYNFNAPIGRTTLLRAYDVSSNSFSLNQADVVIENAVDPANGKHFGARLDLQFGQATATLQGSAANEPRPDIYRNIFQAYGTWAPNHKLTLDFGKWSSSIGLEGNYSKDQINYSRSYLFDFLPFYHMGVRAAYKLNDALTVNYWIDNGTQQTEAFNNFKDELFGFTATPRKNFSWTVNYYLGQEHPDVIYYPVHESSEFADVAGRIVPADYSLAQGKDAHLRQLRHVAADGQVDAGVRRRLRDREGPDNLSADPYRRRRVLCALPVDSKIRTGGAHGVSIGSRRIVFGREPGVEGDDVDHRVQSGGGIRGAPGMASRFFESEVLFNRRAGAVEQAADHGDRGQ